MNTTVRDIAALPEFKGMKLLAGASGLDNVVTRCGFLDYEYDAALRGKYFHRHFDPGEFVLSSFLYAKDNEFHIIDAIKRLHQRQCSGLAIRNIFKLNIRDNVLRFAEANRFPIFLLTDETFYFEDIIFMVTDRVRKADSVDKEARLTDQILYASTETRQADLAREINPSFQEELAAIFFRPEKGPLSPGDYLSLMASEAAAKAVRLTDAAFYYRGGLMLIHSSDLWRQDGLYRDLAAYVEKFSALFGRRVRTGISAIHRRLSELGPAVRESLYCSALPLADAHGCCFYQDIGVFQVLIPAAQDPAAREFSEACGRAVETYDHENNTNLWLTARCFVLNDGDLKDAARELDQHVNTIRYRLDAVGRLLGLNVLSKSGYEALAAAVKIQICLEAGSLVGF